MKKTTELKNLVFENILSESSKFIKPPEDSYIKTYPEFIQFFKNINSISKHNLVISSHFVYGLYVFLLSKQGCNLFAN